MASFSRTVCTRTQTAPLAPLFSVFVGSLWLWADRAVLDGRYPPPGGRLGQAADATRWRTFAARGSARWFLGRIAARLAPDPFTLGQPSWHQLRPVSPTWRYVEPRRGKVRIGP
jgi:hypothetical protein